ncbi:MAG: Septum formation protein Maf [bacterium]|nr:Septum formation protein Maf [bacterium]
MAPPPLVLASASPRRQEILTALGLTFEVAPITGVTEEQMAEDFFGHPRDLAYHIAMKKAGIASATSGSALTIAADTIVVCDDRLLGKPGSPEEAAEFLRLLSGRTHEVITGVGLVDGESGRRVTGEERTLVSMVPLSADDIAGYLASGEPYDKAGGYGIQGLGSLFISGIQGDYWNVVGFPVYRFRQLLAELGHDLVAWSCTPLKV